VYGAEFQKRRDCDLESRLFHFEFVDPLFQTGYRMFGFFHRAIFSVDGERGGYGTSKIENPCFRHPLLGLLPIPGVFLVKYGEMPYYVLEIL